MGSERSELLITLYNYLLKLIPAIKECANCYQLGQINEGSNLLINMIEGVNWVISVTANVQIQGVIIEEINIKLGDMVKAFENEDYVLVGDLLEYEILPVMQELFEKTSTLVQL